MRTRAPGHSPTIVRVASMPLSSGSTTSMTTTSGWSSRCASTASCAVPASPTTAMSCSRSRSSLRPARTTAWSSTRSTSRCSAGMRQEWARHSVAASAEADPRATAFYRRSLYSVRSRGRGETGRRGGFRSRWAKVHWRFESSRPHLSLSVCIAGATGWTGRALVPAVLEAPDLTLGSAVSRSSAGRDLGEALGGEPLGVPVHAGVEDALDGIDVLVDYTSPEGVKASTLAAIAAGVAVVIGTSGLTAADFDEIDSAARERSVGVVASGNFSLTAAMCQAAALLAARHLPRWEVIDYADAAKRDVPSGTARELAERLGEIHRPELGHPIESLHGPQEARGAGIAGT